MLINGSYGSVMENLVLLIVKYFFFAKLPDYKLKATPKLYRRGYNNTLGTL